MPTPPCVEDLTNSAEATAAGDPCPDAVARLTGLRADLYTALTARGDALFELTDALLCAEGSVSSLVGLCLAPEHRRGHGALYDALNAGAIDTDALRTALARLPLPRLGRRIVLAVDASPWLRPDAATAPQRCFCHVYGRGRGSDQRIPGWPYQFVVALEAGPASWTAPLDVVRLTPDQDATEVTATQLRAVIQRLVAAGHWRVGDPAVVVVMDSGYDVTRLAFALADLPLLLIGRVRADRVFLTAVPQRAPGAVGRPRRHGAAVWLAEPTSWPTRAPPPRRPQLATGRWA